MMKEFAPKYAHNTIKRLNINLIFIPYIPNSIGIGLVDKYLIRKTLLQS